jgi:hypothetical protein
MDGASLGTRFIQMARAVVGAQKSQSDERVVETQDKGPELTPAQTAALTRKNVEAIEDRVMTTIAQISAAPRVLWSFSSRGVRLHRRRAARRAPRGCRGHDRRVFCGSVDGRVEAQPTNFLSPTGPRGRSPHASRPSDMPWRYSVDWRARPAARGPGNAPPSWRDNHSVSPQRIDDDNGAPASAPPRNS